MHATREYKQRIVHRLKIARGHLDKVIQMAEDDTYCIDVIHQSQAVQHALSENDNLMLENHLKTCVVDKLKKGQPEKSIEEMLKVFKQKGK